MTTSPITHIIVLQLENRSFDSMMGFWGLQGTDAVTGQRTQINGLTGSESNSITVDGQTQTYTVTQGGYQTMPVDPGHEFADALCQLCGPAAVYTPKGPYPAINNSGFVYDYVNSPSAEEGKATSDFGAIMRGYTMEQLPILSTLAGEFAVCDNWFSSLPGPTWPNRFFVHAASSCGLDDSPSTKQMAAWEFNQGGGVVFPNGTILQALDNYAPLANLSWRLFSDMIPGFSITTALSGVPQAAVSSIADFCTRIQFPDYPWPYTFLEPNYGNIFNGTYQGGSSQHPVDLVVSGEALIKQVYEALRQSPIWNSCLFIITWDEHGGFYDHVAPPPAVAPGDLPAGGGLSTNGFTFEQYGVRVPAVIVSPLIPKNVIDHRLYDHASIPATLEALFGLKPLTKRDAAANNLLPLVSLSTPRTDTPVTLPAPNNFTDTSVHAPAPTPASAPIPNGMQAFLGSAMMADIEMSPPGSAPAIQAHVGSLQTFQDASNYLTSVQSKMQLAQQAAAQSEKAAEAAKLAAASQAKLTSMQTGTA